MKLRVIGCYGGYPAKGVGTSSYLLTAGDYHLLIDCGSGDLLSLEKYFDPLKLNAVVLSHYHWDHIADVGVLQYYWQLHTEGRQESVLPIYGNSADPLNLGSLTWPNSTKGEGYNGNSKLNLGPLTITFKRTIHPVPAYAMRIEDNHTKHVLVYTADSNYFEGLAKFAQNADLLVTDTNYYANKNSVEPRWHMTSSECGKLAKQSNCKKLLLSHLPQYGDLKQLITEARKTAGSKPRIGLAHVGKVVEI
ncbi:MBL fold metallo-hydrolase [Acetilactobacillus jinshanensis]|uniref:MBL fold metallo-hydrolase n=1 Tax=Acetilactobacillus jinshanensis TaxID=1720083 RepID=A0A4P6ZJT2_9LACO|nr:MBL fold metallo-hydrolase [Acetilactobacillus jinshanensis]QBP17884.1 MBL fold metallo-hydrolase [Acetilactobacillus jinshanensis]URL60746.1 MBL fold metallo-hydrolase [uncultured bacterium]